MHRFTPHLAQVHPLFLSLSHLEREREKAISCRASSLIGSKCWHSFTPFFVCFFCFRLLLVCRPFSPLRSGQPGLLHRLRCLCLFQALRRPTEALPFPANPLRFLLLCKPKRRESGGQITGLLPPLRHTGAPALIFGFQCRRHRAFRRVQVGFAAF